MHDGGGVEARRADAGGALDVRPVGRGVADLGVRAGRARPAAVLNLVPYLVAYIISTKFTLPREMRGS